MRAFLRQPSTPWIVFDRASRVAMSETPDVKMDGAVFRSPMSSVLASEGVFPKAPAPEAVAPPVEPSSLTVAADIAVSSEALGVREPEADPEFTTPRPSRGARYAWCGAFGAVAALVVIVASAAHPSPKSAPKAQAASHGPTVVADAPPLALDAVPAAAANVAVAARAVTTEPAKPRRLGKLSLRGAAAYKRVYFDGKLLLGNRARSFDVYCGDHTISIGVRNDEHEIEVPCGGEFVVQR